MLKYILIFTISILYLSNLIIKPIVCPPVNPNADTNNQNEEHQPANETLENDPILSLEYNKYLREIVNILETDPKFKKMIENASVDDIKSGKIASHLEFVNHNIRTKLDELKRQEIERLRKLITRRVALNNLKPHEVESILPKHIDHNNIETFEINDLEKLIKQATKDLEEVDKLRREEFKQHEIQKEYERRKELQYADPETKKKLEADHQKSLEMRKNHPKINHPGSKDQLEEVWEEQDNLEPEQFNPHTFFQLHDIDGNNYLDQSEIEALFQIELDKIFNKTDPEYDANEREEEMNRMREHVFKEIDKNKDRVVSLNEFLDATKQKDFEKNEEWKSVDDEPQYNQQEFENYSKAHFKEEHTRPTPVQNANLEQQHQQVPQQAHP